MTTEVTLVNFHANRDDKDLAARVMPTLHVTRYDNAMIVTTPDLHFHLQSVPHRKDTRNRNGTIRTEVWHEWRLTITDAHDGTNRSVIKARHYGMVYDFMLQAIAQDYRTRKAHAENGA